MICNDIRDYGFSRKTAQLRHIVTKLSSVEISAVIGRVPVTVRDQSGITREIVLLVTERGSAWPVSWIELPCEGTG